MNESNKTPKNTLCKNLRIKNSFGMLEDGEVDWQLLEDMNSICWCIKSVGGSGPDNGLVDPALCVYGRICFESAKE
jgi:hypothetical protein